MDILFKDYFKHRDVLYSSKYNTQLKFYYKKEKFSISSEVNLIKLKSEFFVESNNFIGYFSLVLSKACKSKYTKLFKSGFYDVSPFYIHFFNRDLSEKISSISMSSKISIYNCRISDSFN